MGGDTGSTLTSLSSSGAVGDSKAEGEGSEDASDDGESGTGGALEDVKSSFRLTLCKVDGSPSTDITSSPYLSERCVFGVSSCLDTYELLASCNGLRFFCGDGLFRSRPVGVETSIMGS